ncbi:DUF393 domain-containing protein [Endozoicomonas sp. G2_1]|uniref:thiol-disulfide oxidoreductase DCC family protein n=1 Tax=Endozoicomonas sp. G2_1 TaxID=2821091 RepID=UPI001ADD3834|nr:DUF393 domain-containing protein [Endozoicomonas sp. G2_1]MBO9490903.1 DUF393 domain-containing protein [Endozoicomonas sp. G2_1]
MTQLTDSNSLASSKQVTIFYDGQCPICLAEMKHLKALDDQNLLDLQDLHQTAFAEKFPQVDPEKAMAVLHGRYQGQAIYGLDVTYHAWRAVGKGTWVAILRWPVVRSLADLVYLFFAKHRHRLSLLAERLFPRLAIGQSPFLEGKCSDGQCKIQKTDKR